MFQPQSDFQCAVNIALDALTSLGAFASASGATPHSPKRTEHDSLLLARSEALHSHPFIADLTAIVARRMVHLPTRFT